MADDEDWFVAIYYGFLHLLDVFNDRDDIVVLKVDEALGLRTVASPMPQVVVT